MNFFGQGLQKLELKQDWQMNGQTKPNVLPCHTCDLGLASTAFDHNQIADNTPFSRSHGWSKANLTAITASLNCSVQIFSWNCKHLSTGYYYKTSSDRTEHGRVRGRRVWRGVSCSSCLLHHFSGVSWWSSDTGWQLPWLPVTQQLYHN